MLRNYFLTALRNFWRNKTFSLINIVGLAIGISASLVIFLLVQYDLSFDKFEKDSTRIYRVVVDGTNDGNAFHMGCVTEVMVSRTNGVPGLDLVAAFRTLDETRITTPSPDAAHPLKLHKQEDVVVADESYIKLLGYTWLAGSPATALKQPYQVVLTEKNANRYYAHTNYSDIIGKPITIDDTVQAVVTGIVKDLPGNSDFYFGTIISRPTWYTTRMKPQSFGRYGSTNSADQIFIKLSPGANPALVKAQLDKAYHGDGKPDPKARFKVTIGIQPLSDLHFDPDYGVFDQSRQASRTTLNGLLAVASFLLLLACINFINLTTAQASQRAKEIGIRKTMGSQRRQLIFQFLSETFVLTLLATILSLLLMPFLLKMFSDFIPADFHFNLLQQPTIIVFLLVLIGIVTILSGIYPALVLSGFKPILVLKNQAYANTGKSRSAWLRKSLTVFQFVIAQVFIIATLLVGKQISYALNKDLGFKQDAIGYFRISNTSNATKSTALLNKLKAIPGVALTSVSSDIPSSGGTMSQSSKFIDGKKEVEQNLQMKLGDSNYIRMYGFHLLAGTTPPQSDTTNAVVINETYLHILGYQDPEKVLGKQITNFSGNPHIVGVIADFHPHSLHDPIKPLVICNGTKDQGVINVALRPRTADGSNWATTLAAMEKTFHAIYPDDDYEYHFVDDSIAKFYTAEKNIAKLLAWATGLTIFISCLGLLGLVIYITNQRTKEIGVRKVIGATVTQLILLLSRDFLKLIGLAILIALPISWWGSRKWLDNFVYKTTLSWWVFAAGGATLLLIALIILCIRTLRAALANPVTALRSE